MRVVTQAVSIAVALLVAQVASAQTIDAVGTRPAGMAGAFVAVADDASAVYWNPGALAAASYFSLVVDRTQARTGLAEPSAGSRSSFLIALAAPALGLTYYRLRNTTLAPPDLATADASLGRNVIGPGQVRVSTLVTHHVGATLVQSVTEGVAVGATLKLVRGTAMAGVVNDADRGELLADTAELVGRGSTKFDADIGVLATAGSLRVGLTIRNLREPTFETADREAALSLKRQARAGIALVPMSGWMLAADFDLLKNDGPFGEGRDAAFGIEGRVSRRAFVRGGVRVNTLGGSSPGRAPSVSGGASYAVRGSFLVDAQVTAGSERSARGWGIAGRFVY